ncbi:MAG: BadF/BadG/BcrA/BcrD ATPase family protein [Oscillibacter sp.]
MSIYTMGIDVGSTASKCVILKDGSEIVAKSLVAVGTGTSGPSRAIAQVLENAGMTREQMDFVLATGYGRNSLDGLADMQMSELSCHAKGAAFLFPNVRTVVDIGGQDVKGHRDRERHDEKFRHERQVRSRYRPLPRCHGPRT